MKNKYKDILSDKKEFDTLLNIAISDVGKEEDKRLMSELSNIDEESLRTLLEQNKEPKVISVRNAWWRDNYKYVSGLAACIILGILIIVPMNMGEESVSFKGEQKSNGIENRDELYSPVDTVTHQYNTDTLVNR